jgi:addiction module HigA family antidote
MVIILHIILGVTMAKAIQTPGLTIQLFLRGYQLNPTNLAKHLKLSQATVRLLTLDKTRISAHMALRLAKFFNMKPEYWLNLQNEYDLDQAESDSKLKSVLKSIPVAKKPSAADTAKPKKQTAKKTVKTPAKTKTAVKTKTSGKTKSAAPKRGRPAKK